MPIIYTSKQMKRCGLSRNKAKATTSGQAAACPFVIYSTLRLLPK